MSKQHPMFLVAAFYQFVDLPDFKKLQEPIETLCRKNGVLGTVLLAEEGINGTLAGSDEGMRSVLSGLRSIPEFAGLEHKESVVEKMPFVRLKVRFRKEIVTLGIPGINPALRTGTYVEAEKWNDVVSQPDVVVVDTRNDYEVAIGSFKGALDPHTKTFREFPAFVEKNLDPKKTPKVAMYCTGGIRCEKASAYLLSKGFSEVYHLKGGILKYLEKVRPEDSRWEGECFVFDKRVSVDHSLKKGAFDFCPGCRRPVAPEDKSSRKYISGVACPKCHDSLSEDQKKRFAERDKQIRLAKARREAQGQIPSF
ncbi:MAG: rhodanese-related sulfurtransferase [Spirochaetia bacterium]|nr:rhodanese-related sulfurtransferase [Spirochaetia bacterium]